MLTKKPPESMGTAQKSGRPGSQCHTSSIDVGRLSTQGLSHCVGRILAHEHGHGHVQSVQPEAHVVCAQDGQQALLHHALYLQCGASSSYGGRGAAQTVTQYWNR